MFHKLCRQAGHEFDLVDRLKRPVAWPVRFAGTLINRSLGVDGTGGDWSPPRDNSFGEVPGGLPVCAEADEQSGKKVLRRKIQINAAVLAANAVPTVALPWPNVNFPNDGCRPGTSVKR